MHAIHIIRRPLLTEKANLAMEEGRYTFEVAASATKMQIRDAIKQLYSVDAVKINTSIHQGRDRAFKHGLMKGKVSKKAIVRLKDGQRIELF